MIKETVQYVDYNGVNRTESLYFNINQSELMDNLNLREDLEKIQENLEGPERQLTTEEVQRILNLVKRMMKLAYGVRSEDGLRFRKSEEIYEDFYSSKAYDEFIMSLFKNPEKAFEFLVACMPAELMEQARREMGENVVELPPHRNVFEQTDAAQEAIVVPDQGTLLEGERKWDSYTIGELESMPNEQFEALYNAIKGPKPMALVQIGMKRKARNDS